MTQDPRHVPTHVKAPHGAPVTEIAWADGHRSLLPNRLLRGYCPCAHCQGHGGTIAFVAGGNAELMDIERVGNYALSFAWGDSHTTGIYTFKYLRALCQCDECKPASAYRVPDSGGKEL